MDIYVNDKLNSVAGGAKVSEVLESLNIVQQKGIAIAVNNQVIPRDEWIGHVLKEADRVTLIVATQGG